MAALESIRAGFRFGSAPKDSEGDEMNLNRIRAPLFAFILAEEMTRSYLPTYVNQLLVPIPGLSPQVVIGLPIMLFMLIVALGQPYLGSWSERVGRRRAMLIGASIATVGFPPRRWRSTSTTCCCGARCARSAMRWSSWPRRATCSTAPATRTGRRASRSSSAPSWWPRSAARRSAASSPTTSASARRSRSPAVMALTSLLAIARLPAIEVRTNTSPRPSRGPRMREVMALTLNKRFMTLTGFAAVPAKIILTGVCFYLVPLYIVSIGNTSAMAGRMLMVYAVMMVLIVPLSASLSDASMRRDRYVSVGLIISGLSGLLLLVSDSFLVLFGVVFLLGLGQALSIAAQSALVAEHCQEEIRIYGHDAVYGVYRLLERLGNAAGPLIASILVIFWGYQGAFIAIGAGVLICGIAFTIATRGLDWQPAPANPMNTLRTFVVLACLAVVLIAGGDTSAQNLPGRPVPHLRDHLPRHDRRRARLPGILRRAPHPGADHLARPEPRHAKMAGFIDEIRATRPGPDLHLGHVGDARRRRHLRTPTIRPSTSPTSRSCSRSWPRPVLAKIVPEPQGLEAQRDRRLPRGAHRGADPRDGLVPPVQVARDPLHADRAELRGRRRTRCARSPSAWASPWSRNPSSSTPPSASPPRAPRR
jgi:MFS family permease